MGGAMDYETVVPDSTYERDTKTVVLFPLRILIAVVGITHYTYLSSTSTPSLNNSMPCETVVCVG